MFFHPVTVGLGMHDGAVTISGVASSTPVDVMAAGALWSRRLVLVVVALAVAAWALPSAAHDVFVLVLVAVGLLAGLPHGAVDHRLAAGLTGWPPLVVGAVYAGVAALAWLLISTTGLVALIPVLALSLVHFALGELEVVRATTGWNPSTPAAVAVAVAGTGALLLPLARADEQLVAVAGSISPHLGALLGAELSRAALVAVWGLAAAGASVAALLARQPVVVLDIVLVGLLGAVAPPLVAFAVWFGGWHALRHCARLLTVDPPSAALLALGHPGRAVGELVRAARWPSLAAVAVLAALVVASATAADPAAAVGTTLVVLLALTVPHMLVVLGIDRIRISAARR
jgi:Brp/Blh family beta-carotene 15,15'-monooxygenase